MVRNKLAAQRRSGAMGIMAVRVALAFVMFGASVAYATSGTNMATGAQTTNWTGLAWTGGTPNGIGDTAAFNFNIAGDQNITLNTNVTLGRLECIGSGQFNLFRSGLTNKLTFDNTSAGTVASVLQTRTNHSSTARTLQSDIILNSDLIFTLPRPAARNHGVLGIVSGSGRLSCNLEIAPTEGPDTNAVTANDNQVGRNFLLGTIGDGANSYTGGTDLRAGNATLGTEQFIVKKVDALGTGTTAGRLYMYQAALDLNSFNQTVGGLSGGANRSKIDDWAPTNGTTTLTLDFPDTKGPWTFSGVIQNTSNRTVALTKQGAGLQTLTGVNTYAGVTKVLGGMLQIADDLCLGAVPGSAVTNQLQLDGGALSFVSGNGVESVTVSAPDAISSNSTIPAVSVTSSGTDYNFRANNGINALTAGTGGSNVMGFTVTIGPPDLPGGVQAAASGIVSNGVVTGYMMTTNGSGYSVAPAITVAITNGTTGTKPAANPTVQTYIFRGVSVLAFGQNMAGTTFSVSGVNAVETATPNYVVPTLAANRGITLGASGGALSADVGTTLTVLGQISGSGTLIKTGAGTLTLAATNSYTGATVVSNGVLSLAVASCLTTNSAVCLTGSGKMSNTVNQVVGSLYFDGELQTLGTWGSVDSSASHKSTRFQGSNIVEVLYGVNNMGTLLMVK